jgi:hypothetical protein
MLISDESLKDVRIHNRFATLIKLISGFCSCEHPHNLTACK